MDCHNARLLLIFSRNHLELDDDDTGALQSHLAGCSACAGLARAESRLDEALGRAVRDVPLPAGLANRLHRRLEQDRRLRRWRLLRASAAVAAALFLAAGLGWYFFFPGNPDVNLSVLQDEITAKVAASPQKVEEWFQEQGLAMETPARFNYHLLYSFDTAHFLNRLVPRLLFHSDRDGAIAEVYVLARDRFHFDHLDRELPFAHSHHSIHLMKSEDGRFAFLVFLSRGGSLEAFLQGSDL